MSYNDLRYMDIKPGKTKYFKCNVCKNHQLVEPEDIHDIFEPITPSERYHVHADLTRDLGITFKNFCNNFGGYKGGIIALLDQYYKSLNK